ncbi:DNA repair protein RecO [Candidatus Rubidus massiliensis]|nr:MAG: DNA repair protein RecO [Chlamydia sp. 32-24]CDZ80899.1 DNA repair protein RecO [Candidatus Rubidus massiliensis]
MAENFTKTPIIITRLTPFQDFDLIIEAFSYEHGMIKIIAKKFTLSKVKKSGVVDALTYGEAVYTKQKSNFYKLQELHTLQAFLPLRQNLTKLETASTLLKDLKKGLPFEKPTPMLFQLTLSYLKRACLDATNLSESFKLKLLRHEGVYPLSLDNDVYESPTLRLMKEEVYFLNSFTFATSFSSIQSFSIPEEMQNKINILFQESIVT